MLNFYYIFVQNKDIMKVLKLLLIKPHYLIAMVVIGVLFVIGSVFEILSFPFLLVVKSTGLLIKNILKLLK